jgi:peptidoglycan/xylan/chitin deacetylase (PgdA/CDA1 family)
MALRTPPSAATPAPVLLGALVLVALAIVFLGYRAYDEWRESGETGLPTDVDFELGKLAQVRVLTRGDILSSTPHAVPSPRTAGRWSERLHSLQVIREPEALKDPARSPVLTQETEFPSEPASPAAVSSWSSVSHPPSAPTRAAGEAGSASFAASPTLSLADETPAGRRTEPAQEPASWASQSHPPGLPRPARGAPAARSDATVLEPVEPLQVATMAAPPIASTPAQADKPYTATLGPILPAAVLARGLTRGDVTLPELLLSFDGGSEASSAVSILDTLEREGVRTTLFLTGEFIRNHPDLVQRILTQGHEIGNHTQSHRHLTTWETNRRHDTRPDVDRGVLLRELEAARQALQEVAAVDMAPFWRAPYGEVNREILHWAAEAGYLHVGWTPGFDSLDWVADPDSRHYRTPEEFLSLLARKARGESQGLNGAIILMHLHSNRPWSDRFDRQLGQVIRWLHAAGYRMVPASSLAGITGTPGAAYRVTTSPGAGGR